MPNDSTSGSVCPSCGNFCDSAFCPKCGFKIDQSEIPMVPIVDEAMGMPRKRTKFLVVGLAVVLIGVGVFILFHRMGPSSSANANATGLNSEANFTSFANAATQNLEFPYLTTLPANLKVSISMVDPTWAYVSFSVTKGSGVTVYLAEESGGGSVYTFGQATAQATCPSQMPAPVCGGGFINRVVTVPALSTATTIAAAPSSSTTSQPSSNCSLMSSSSSSSSQTRNFVLSNQTSVNLMAPTGYVCAPFSGAGATYSQGGLTSSPTSQLGVSLAQYGSRNDIYPALCLYSAIDESVAPGQPPNSCSRRKVTGETVKYLSGSSTSSYVTILVTDAAGISSPAGVSTNFPSYTVMSFSSSLANGLSIMTCSLPPQFKSDCLVDVSNYTVAIDRFNAIG